MASEEEVSGERIIPVKIEEQMKTAYIDYSMSVIVSRALPDVRDGLKPVHRRILYGMNEIHVTANTPTKKSARIVGDVLGKYHPHGDSSVYGALVHLAQPWSLRYPLIDGQGNFGSMDGDSPAAMRYTEVRMRKIAEDMLIDIEKETVDMVPNFDESLVEPTVLPTRIPYLLVNGGQGIAVGMATNMPPHNMRDAINAVIAYIDNPEIETEELIKVIKAPDFPTGATIYGYQGVKDAYTTGRGRIVIRSKCEFEQIHGHDCIIVTEIPYMVNKAEMIMRIAELVQEGKLAEISNINDESDQHGLRIVIELKRDAVPNIVLNHLYKNTALQSSFGVNNVAIVKYADFTYCFLQNHPIQRLQLFHAKQLFYPGLLRRCVLQPGFRRLSYILCQRMLLRIIVCFTANIILPRKRACSVILIQPLLLPLKLRANGIRSPHVGRLR